MHNQYIYLIAPISAWIISQLIKMSIEALRNQKIKFSDWLSSGNFPSTHVAGPTAFLTVTYHLKGPGDPLFAIGLLFTLLVAYDSLGVRRTAAESAVTIGKLIKATNLKVEPIHIFKGHTPVEVIAGGVLGIVVGSLVYFLF